jgi:hypothetical protein
VKSVIPAAGLAREAEPPLDLNGCYAGAGSSNAPAFRAISNIYF